MQQTNQQSSESGLYSGDFSKAFAAVLQKTGVTCYQIAQYTGLDQGYLSHLRTGEKSNPSVETVLKIGVALAHLSDKVALFDVEALLNATGRSLRTRH